MSKHTLPVETYPLEEGACAPGRLIEQCGPVFESLFERSADAIWLFDPEAGVFLDCNQAAVELIGAKNKEQLLRVRPEEISPPFQPDGSRSVDKTVEVVTIVKRE